MDTKLLSTVARSYEDYQPPSDWIRGDKSDTFLVELPGFVKEQLRVQLDNWGNLKISGERPIEGNKWTRFRKDVRVPDHCDKSQIRATLEDGTLKVTMPKTNLASSTTPTKPTRTTQKPPPLQPTPKTDQTSFQPKTKPDTTDSNTPQATAPSAGGTKKHEKKTKEKNEKQEPQGPKQLPTQEMTSDRNKSNGLSVNGKEKGSGDRALDAETASFGQKRSSWFGDGGGLMRLLGLSKYKPSKLAVSVVVAVVVAVAVGVGLYEAYKGSYSPEENGV